MNINTCLYDFFQYVRHRYFFTYNMYIMYILNVLYNDLIYDIAYHEEGRGSVPFRVTSVSYSMPT